MPRMSAHTVKNIYVFYIYVQAASPCPPYLLFLPGAWEEPSIPGRLGPQLGRNRTKSCSSLGIQFYCQH